MCNSVVIHILENILLITLVKFVLCIVLVQRKKGKLCIFMQRSYKLYMMLGMPCILNCCVNKVPLTAMYLCLSLGLRVSALS